MLGLPVGAVLPHRSEKMLKLLRRKSADGSKKAGMYTGYYLLRGRICGPGGETDYYFYDQYVYGPSGYTRHYVADADGHLYGPGGDTQFYIEHDCIYGPATTLPWT
ncbi:MAG: hypothetical protein DRI39_07250 [Chloroflexi bacterium]|nr:MAG: hypothetical protein DRI39_07250 [Chloroflexota bacterium]RLC96771.1 MAG: hypothetical protein DRI40_02195 [Chloroflexota bacterium]